MPKRARFAGFVGGRPLVGSRVGGGSVFIGRVQIRSSADWTFISNGDRSNSTLTVTRLPMSSLGTRHECEQTPPQPNSRLPEATCLPSAVMVKVGFGGCREPDVLSRKKVE